MRRLLAPLGVFLAATLLAGIYLLPATWLDYALQRATNGVLSLGDAQGRIWEGSGVLQAMLPAGQVIAVDRVGWSVAAAEIPLARFRFVLFSVRSGKPIVDASLDGYGVMFHSSRLELPASVLGTFSPTLRELGLTGQLVFKADDFRLSHPTACGAAEVLWTDAGSNLARVSPLGNYRFDLKGQADRLDCTISTDSGAALKVTGTCQQRLGGPFLLDATAEPAASQRNDLAPLLRIMGRETSPGVYQLQLDPNVGIGAG